MASVSADAAVFQQQSEKRGTLWQSTRARFERLIYGTPGFGGVLLHRTRFAPWPISRPCPVGAGPPQDTADF